MSEYSGSVEYRSRLDQANSFGEVYEIVKDTVKRSLGEYRVGMMLYLDDLPLKLGAYHSVGTNIIVLNSALLRIVEASEISKRDLNSFVYTLLIHEYLHALGHLKESKVRQLAYKVAEESFGENHLATDLARKGPWSILRGVPLDEFEVPRRVMEIVKDFEKTDTGYIA
jgi:histidinol phosphatase-like PHP family hydrolase